jgi:hypothetical protein
LRPAARVEFALQQAAQQGLALVFALAWESELVSAWALESV